VSAGILGDLTAATGCGTPNPVTNRVPPCAPLTRPNATASPPCAPAGTPNRSRHRARRRPLTRSSQIRACLARSPATATNARLDLTPEQAEACDHSANERFGCAVPAVLKRGWFVLDTLLRDAETEAVHYAQRLAGSSGDLDSRAEWEEHRVEYAARLSAALGLVGALAT